MEKPTSLDSVEITALNTLIACEGKDRAEDAYRRRCFQGQVIPEPWALRYLSLYVKYSGSKDSYIDVPAAQRALQEA